MKLLKYGDLRVGNEVIFKGARSCVFEVISQDVFQGAAMPRVTLLKCTYAAQSFERTHGWGAGEIWRRDVGDLLEDHGGTLV